MTFNTRINWETEVPNLKQMTQNGLTFVAIAESYGVSKQRIKQIFQKFRIEHVGLKKKQKDKVEAWDLKWGKRDGSDIYQAQRHKYRAKKAFAKRTGTDFTVAFGEIDWPTHCPILGLEIDYFAETRQENSPSFDQIIPRKGYVAGNVQILSWRANRIKNDGTAEEHRKIAEYLCSLQG